MVWYNYRDNHNIIKGGKDMHLKRKSNKKFQGKKVFIKYLFVTILLCWNVISINAKASEFSINDNLENRNVTNWSNEYTCSYVFVDEVSYQPYKKILEKVFKEFEPYAKKQEMYHLKLVNSCFSITKDENEYIYIGETKNNKPDGIGGVFKTLKISDILLNRPVYIGEFKRGKYDGNGVSYGAFDDKEEEEQFIFEMNFLDKNEIVRDYLSQINYIGHFKKGKFSGQGMRLEYPSVSLLAKSSLTADNQANELMQSELGLGNIQIQVGHYEKGVLDGEVKMYVHQKLRYEGNVKKDMFNGKGIMYFIDSSQVEYKGNFKNNKYHGKGTLYTEDGDVIYNGKWEMGDYES